MDGGAESGEAKAEGGVSGDEICDEGYLCGSSVDM
jgi:hypothetical protein